MSTPRPIGVFGHVLFLCFFLCFLLFSCQKGEDAGIETVDGVPVVRNPKEPVAVDGKLAKITLEEELAIGDAEGRDEYMFSQVASLAVDDEGNIYVLDYLRSHIRIFNDRGEYLFTIGETGQGPLEFIEPGSLLISAEEHLVVDDSGNNLLKFFTLDGKFIKSLSTATLSFFSRFKMDSQGNITARTARYNAKDAWFEVSRFDPELNLIKVIASYNFPFRSDFNPYRSHFHWQIRRDDVLVIGMPVKYELQMMTAEGEITKRIVKDYNPVEITEEEKEEERKKHPDYVRPVIPKYYPPYQTFTLDEEDRVFVQTWKKVGDGPGFFYDVFNPEGRHITTFPLESRPLIWKNGKLYALFEDEKGLQKIKRYQARWA